MHYVFCSLTGKFQQAINLMNLIYKDYTKIQLKANCFVHILLFLNIYKHCLHDKFAAHF